MTNALCVLETVQDRLMVVMKHQEEVRGSRSIRVSFDDLE